MSRMLSFVSFVSFVVKDKDISCTYTFIPNLRCYCPVNHLTASRAEAWSNFRRNLMNGPSLVKSAPEKSRSLKPVML